MNFEKNILITGGCGFIGSNFINHIHDLYTNAFIVCIDTMYYSASIDNIKEHVRNSNRFKMYYGNINDTSLLFSIFQSHNITDIIHFAAQSHVDCSFENSLQYTKDNVLGTHNLLETVRKFKPDVRFYHFSTDEVYGESNLDEEPKHETSLLCPTNPYAATKACAEMLVNAYKHSYKLKAIIVRCNNVYGPNQYPEKLIPKFISLLKNDQKCTIQGDGSSIRSFIHVKDVCTAVCTIMEKGTMGEIYNIGSDPHNELTVIQVLELLLSLIKPNEKKEDWIEYIEDRPFNDKRYFITNDKVKALGWTQSVEFNKGILELI